MRFLAFILNLPWTVIGIIAACVSIPVSLRVNVKPFAFVFKVRSFWWYAWLPGKKNLRGMAEGNVVILGPKELEKDLEHELIHVEQFERTPFIHPFLYAKESWKKGYRQNKYEDEAYTKSGNKYFGR